MAEGRNDVQFVLDSKVRSETLGAVVGDDSGTRETRDVVETVEASESAVYDALDCLERRGLVVSGDDGWVVTGQGRITADLLVRRDRSERLFADTDYWATHDVTVLPRRFRTRLPELAAAEVMEATATEPHRVVDEVASRIQESETARVVSPIYVSDYDESMPDDEDARLVVSRSLVEKAVSDVDSPDALQTFTETPVRITDVDFALGVCDDCVLLSLPTLDGQYDARAEVIGEDDRALRWGRQLFDHYWERADPLDRVLGAYFD